MEPIHEIAAIAPSHSAHAVGIHIGEFGECFGHLYHIFIGFATPIAGNAGGEFLSVAGGAVWVGIRHHISCTGIHLPIGAERVHPLHLRSAVHIHHERIFFVGVEIVRLHHPHFYHSAIGTFHPHGFRRSDIHFLFQCLVEEGELLFRLAADFAAIECGGLSGGRVGVVEIAVGAYAEIRHGAVGEHFGVLAGGNIHLKDGHQTVFLHPEIDAFAVGSPHKIVVHPIVDIFGEHGFFAGGTVVERQAEAVALMTGHFLKAIGNVAAVG